jgi:NADPH:quinone reductase-like Zn-dependent oxidoreductase
MKAVIITRPGGPEVLEIQERPKPEPGVGQIRVRVRASALNRADLMQRAGNYPVPPGASAEMSGMEYSGEVDAIGPAAALWKIGDRVMGIVVAGGHAEYLCVHEREAMPAPRALSWENLAAIPEAFLTAYDALFNRLRLRPGETVLIHAVEAELEPRLCRLLAWQGRGLWGRHARRTNSNVRRSLGSISLSMRREESGPRRSKRRSGRSA